MPALRDHFRRVIKTFRLRPWLKDFDVTRLARKLEHWSYQVMELERSPNRDPPDHLAREIGWFVIRLLQESMGLRKRTYRKNKPQRGEDDQRD
jgi:hypothetical protein